MKLLALSSLHQLNLLTKSSTIWTTKWLVQLIDLKPEHHHFTNILNSLIWLNFQLRNSWIIKPTPKKKNNNNNNNFKKTQLSPYFNFCCLQTLLLQFNFLGSQRNRKFHQSILSSTITPWNYIKLLNSKIQVQATNAQNMRN